MNVPQKPQHDMNNVAAYLITLPFIAITTGGTLAKSFFMKNAAAKAAAKQTQVPAAIPSAPSAPESLLTVRPPAPTFGPATRVYSTIVGNLTLCFYEYNKPRVIKITTRKGGVMKEAFFTPDIAIEACLVFTIDGALAWIRKRGFKGDPPANVVPMEKPRMPAVKVVAAPAATSEVTVMPAPAIAAAPVKPSNARVVSSNKRPFTGRIVEFGPSKRPGRDGKPEYTTYLMALENSDIGRREFLGEQLAELVENHSLQVGMKVRLHSLGKQHFTVEVAGVKEQRNRNEYAIDIL